jgi:hypothetical protein
MTTQMPKGLIRGLGVQLDSEALEALQQQCQWQEPSEACSAPERVLCNERSCEKDVERISDCTVQYVL